ncbi:methyltransferase domain-containing protein [Candidatus Woesearchaeota archaeon]|nr:methyltransferase domain-containing protein [Candidatus Woesearchaeota archaeon]
MEWETEVKKHYQKQAEELGDSKQSTMRDIFIRDGEINELIANIKRLNIHFNECPQILEIGCGNGYLAEQIEKQLSNKLIGIDFSEELLSIAKNRNLNNSQFKLGDVTKLNFPDNSFNIIIAERCLINLDSWENQKKSLEEIRRVLTPGGFFIMIEAFTDGWDNLNQAREVVSLTPIPQPFHNHFFDKAMFKVFIKDKFELVDFGQKYNFLSSYYFGARVLYPSLMDQKKEIVYNNKFVEFFNNMPPYGNYASIQQFILKKRD